MGNNRFMVVSEKDGIIAMNPSYVELKGKNLIIYMLSWNTKRKKRREAFLTT